MALLYPDRQWLLNFNGLVFQVPELTHLDKLPSFVVIYHVKFIFARHGIREVADSDNTPQFSSSRFTLAKYSNLKRTMSTPYVSESNTLMKPP